MGGAVDFSEWVAPDLVLTLGDRTYTVPAPSVERAQKIIALAVQAEVDLGIVEGEVPDRIKDLLTSLGPDERPGLGPVADQLVADEVAVQTISNMHIYSVFYWARGEEYADAIAVLLWAPRAAVTGDEPAPKARVRSPRKSGRSTASASRSTST
jgi:hypothetical protein